MSVPAIRRPNVRQLRSTRRLTRLMHSELDKFCEEVGAPYDEVIARVVVGMAAGGDMDAIKFLTERVEGRVTQSVAMTDRDGLPIEHITHETSAVDASRIYAQVLAAGGDDLIDIDDVDDPVGASSNVIDLAARRLDE